MATTARIGIIGLTIGLGLWILAGNADGGDKGRWKPILPEEAFKQLLEREAAIIQEKLKSKDEDDYKRADFGAVMIAASALSHAKANKDSNAVGGLAQELATAIRTKGKLDQARKLAAGLTAAPGNAKAPNKIDVGELDISDIMNPLKTVGKGGDGIHPDLQVNIRLKGTQNGVEEKIRNLAAKKLTEASMKKTANELALLGYRMAVLAEVVHEYAPKKGAKEWLALTGDMRSAALDLAQSAQKKDIDAVFQAGNKLNSACNQCHSEFRKK